MLLTFNYFLIDVKQIIYLSTVFAAETEVIGTMAKFQNTCILYIKDTSNETSFSLQRLSDCVNNCVHFL
jgi:hypothetical protein